MPIKIHKFQQWRALNEDEIPQVGGATTPPATGTPATQVAPTDPTAGLNMPPISNPTSSGLPDPSIGGMGFDPATQPAIETPPPYKLVFLDPNTEWHIQKSDGGGTKKYMEYQIEDAELDAWLQEKGWTEDKQQFQKLLNGEKHSLDADKSTSFNQDVINQILGDESGEVEIDYDENNEPFVSDIDITFIGGEKSQKPNDD